MRVLGTTQPVLRIKNDRYEVRDLHLEDFVLSETCLNRNKSTRGHTHYYEEVYYFVEGRGRIQVGEKTRGIEAGNVVIIPHSEFHRVFNDNHSELTFLSIFKGVASHSA